MAFGSELGRRWQGRWSRPLDSCQSDGDSVAVEGEAVGEAASVVYMERLRYEYKSSSCNATSSP